MNAREIALEILEIPSHASLLQQAEAPKINLLILALNQTSSCTVRDILAFLIRQPQTVKINPQVANDLRFQITRKYPLENKIN